MSNSLHSPSSQERLLEALKDSPPQSAASLGTRLGVTAVAIRQHLDRLSRDGLVTFEDRRETVGRPKRYWRLTASGHARFPDRHSNLSLELLDAVSTVFGNEGLDRLIAHRETAMLAAYRERLAGAATLSERVRLLASLRTAEGYMATWSTDDDEVFLLVEHHCPICAAASRCRGLCRSELQIFQAALGPDASVERIDHIFAGARRCAYRIEAARTTTT